MDVITKEQCEQTLKNFVGNRKVLYKSVSIQQLLGCSGYIGVQYTVKLCYQEEEKEKIAHLFLKNLDKSNLFMYKMSNDIRGCEKESFYYGTVLPLLESYNINCDFAPRSYFCGKEFIVLEDLSLQSFKEFPKQTHLDFDQCKTCLETLAKFHVSSILYEIRKSEELGRPYTLVEDFAHMLKEEFCSGENSGTSKYFRYSVLGLCDVVDLVDIDDIDKEDFKLKLKDLIEQLFVKKSDHTEFKSTIVHADVWSMNYLCQFYDTGRIKQCKLIDYHTISYGPITSDVQLFIFINTRKEFRDLYYSKLQEHYYNFFSLLLEEQHIKPCEVLPLDEYKRGCQVFKPIAKVFATVERALTSTPDEMYKEATQTHEMFERFWYQDRGKYMVKCFEESDEIRNLFIEEFTELATMIYT